MNQPLIIEQIINSPISSNCYLIYRRGVNTCLVVDPASGNEDFLEDSLSAENLQPEYVILTHEHFDHISSVEYLRNKYDCKVLATRICSENIGHPKKNLSLFYDQTGFVCRPADIIVEQSGWQFEWMNVSFVFYLTPGHSEGSLCFSFENNLFTGDTILKDYQTVIKLPGGNKEKLKESAKMLFDSFDGKTIIYPGHGQTFHLSEINISSLMNEK